MQEIADDPDLSLQLVVTGMHLSPEFGLTYRDIESDGFKIDRKIETLISSDTAVGVSKSIGLGIIGFAEAWNEMQPDVVVVLGDRYEIFAASVAAMIAGLPIAHIHGGETTEGAFDEALRHSITKMSCLHFVAAEEYRNRVIQLGEQPDHVFLVGGLGVDNIKRLKLLDRCELESALGFTLGRRNLLVTFHPVTREPHMAINHMEQLLSALSSLHDTELIFTMPNADTEGRSLINLVDSFVAKHSNAHSFQSLGQLRYLSCVAHVDGVVGNSSSGLAEVPSLKRGTINIGDRQRGRLTAASVIQCDPSQDSISNAINYLYSPEFQTQLKDVRNPYGDGGASERVVNVLKQFHLEHALKKKFYNLPMLAGSCD